MKTADDLIISWYLFGFMFLLYELRAGPGRGTAVCSLHSTSTKYEKGFSTMFGLPLCRYIISPMCPLSAVVVFRSLFSSASVLSYHLSKNLATTNFTRYLCILGTLLLLVVVSSNLLELKSY